MRTIYVPQGTVYSVIAEIAERAPDKVAFELIGVAATTYAQLIARADRVAAMLLSHGVKAGDRVAIMSDNRVEVMDVLLGSARIGAVFVPLGSALRGEILRNMVERAEPAVFIAEEEWRERIEDVWSRPVVYIPPASAEAPWPASAAAVAWPPQPDMRDLCLILFTSGTTGLSKGVMWAHSTVIHMAASFVAMNELTADDVLHSALPVTHGNAMILTVYAAFVLGATAVISPKFTASGYDTELARAKATFTNILGSMSNILIEQKPAAEKPGLGKAFVIPAAPDVQKAIESRYGCTVMTGYGLSDAGLPILSGPRFPAGACGRLLDQIWEARIVDEKFNEVPAGKSGELVVRARVERASAFGYWRMQEETAERYQDGWVATGDLFSRSPEGWFFFLDRAKDAIRRRGENISSQEVESVIATHPAIADCAVYPVPSEMSEDEVMAAVIVAPGQSLSELDLVKFVEKKLPYFAVPRFVCVVTELPRTDTQKVQKAELRKRGITPTTWDREKAGYRLSR